MLADIKLGISNNKYLTLRTLGKSLNYTFLKIRRCFVVTTLMYAKDPKLGLVMHWILFGKFIIMGLTLL
ncbi:hypothetical protein D1094_08485 [Colwellia sp. RSH04]|nr:hypothetical protein D1094_08485 [Colwellia sp. RSH04]